MEATQYIGARYVPVFADPVTWSDSREYEPLTMVLHDGDTYTSKQYVPKQIAITNEKFWVKTSDANAQVQRAIEAVSDEATIRSDADAGLSRSISDEETARIGSDAVITENVNNLTESVSSLEGDARNFGSNLERINEFLNPPPVWCVTEKTSYTTPLADNTHIHLSVPLPSTVDDTNIITCIPHGKVTHTTTPDAELTALSNANSRFVNYYYDSEHNAVVFHWYVSSMSVVDNTYELEGTVLYTKAYYETDSMGG